MFYGPGRKDDAIHVFKNLDNNYTQATKKLPFLSFDGMVALCTTDPFLIICRST